MPEETSAKKTTESGYAHNVGPVGAKMDQEKSSYYSHHHGPLKAVFGVLFFVLILSVVFALGRVSRKNFAVKGFGRSTTIEVGRGGWGGMMGGRGMMNGYYNSNDTGAYQTRIPGQISAVNSDNIAIKDADGTAYIVKIASTTSIIINGKIDKTSNLKTSGEVVVLGSSNSDGSISASLIRSLQ